ncbi:hypothetical protein BUE80_DR010462 [Diplocarpon rosae]|nr:hypothetical protein BUE80_DR010462 [Diplocarpon rosae]
MSLTRIPLQQVFRSKQPRREKSYSVSSRDSDELTRRSSSSSHPPAEDPDQASPPAALATQPESGFAPRSRSGSSRRRRSTRSRSSVFGLGAMSAPPPMLRGTRTPQMLEYERQAEERAREVAQVEEERGRMGEERERIAREQERIAQEEYEMRQYYEAEALRHAEEMRLHKEEVRRHQELVKDHDRRIRDHEASSEAFAKVIVMPVRGGRAVSFVQPQPGGGVRNDSVGSMLETGDCELEQNQNQKDIQKDKPASQPADTWISFCSWPVVDSWIFTTYLPPSTSHLRLKLASIRESQTENVGDGKDEDQTESDPTFSMAAGEGQLSLVESGIKPS